MFERTLIIETSSKIGRVAVASEGSVLAERLLPEVRRHARDLAMRCGELLAELNWRARDLSAVVACVGPGSFTGLRVGLASAKALAYATKCALFGVPALTAIAARIPLSLEPLEIIADALQGQVYCEAFAWHEAAWQSQGPIRIRSFSDWQADVKVGSTVAGPAAELYREKLSPAVAIVDGSFVEPDTASLLSVAQADPSRYRANAWEIEPIYLRGSSAEEKRKHECRD